MRTTKYPWERINPWLVEIPASAREDMLVPARIYVDDVLWERAIGDRTLDQLVNVATMPGITGFAYAMPDAHEGYGFPVGGVAAFRAPYVRPAPVRTCPASFEVGRRRVPASMLSAFAKALAVSVEELLGDQPKPAKRGPASKLQRQMERISQLPRAKQRFVLEMLDTVLQQASR